MNFTTGLNDGVPGEAVFDRLRVVAGPPARDPDQVAEGELHRHVGEPAQ